MLRVFPQTKDRFIDFCFSREEKARLKLCHERVGRATLLCYFEYAVRSGAAHAHSQRFVPCCCPDNRVLLVFSDSGRGG